MASLSVLTIDLVEAHIAAVRDLLRIWPSDLRVRSDRSVLRVRLDWRAPADVGWPWTLL